jgi:DNA replication protein DnaC
MLIPGRLDSGHTTDRDHSETNPPVWHRTHSTQPPLNPPRRRNLRATQTPQTGALTGHRSILLIGLGIAAAEAGHRVRYVLASRLVNELAEADNDRTLSKVIARYGRVDLLCLDELGYLGLDRRGAELLFQVLTEREERAAIAVASNEPFSGWTKTFTDPRLCAAIVDRLTFAGHIIETGTTSYRLAHTRTRQAGS